MRALVLKSKAITTPTQEALFSSSEETMKFRLTTQSQCQDITKTNYNNLVEKLFLAKLTVNLEQFITMNLFLLYENLSAYNVHSLFLNYQNTKNIYLSINIYCEVSKLKSCQMLKKQYFRG